MITTPTAASAAVWTLSGRYAWSRTTGRPNRASVSAWPAPHERPRRPARRVPSSRVGCDQGGHRRQVVRVGRVAQAEQQRHEQDEQEPAALSELGDPVVKPEHGPSHSRPRGARSPRRAGRRRCRRRSAAAASGTSTRRPSASSEARVRASSKRFWNTPPDSTTVDRARPLGRGSAGGRRRAREGVVEPRGHGRHRDAAIEVARDRADRRARVEDQRLPRERERIRARVDRVGRRLQLHGRLALVVHLGSDAAQGGHRVEEAAGTRGDGRGGAGRRSGRPPGATRCAARARAARGGARAAPPARP